MKATVCFYPTGVHDGKLGSDEDAGSLEKAGDIAGRLLLVWAARIRTFRPASAPDRERTEGRGRAVRATHVSGRTRLHARLRTAVRPRVTDLAFAEMVRFFRATF